MDKFTSKHLPFIMLGLGVVSIKTYPTIFTQLGGRDTWIALIIASILIVLSIMYMLWICQKTEVYNMHQVYQKAFGKVLGNILISFFVIAIFLSILESSAVEANAMHVNFLLFTPNWWFVLVTMLAGLYVVKKGEATVIVTVVLSIVMISLSGFILYLVTEKYKDYKYLMPVLVDGITPNFLWAILKILGAYSCIAIIFVYINSMKANKKLLRHSFLGLLFLIQMQIISMIGNIVTFGIDQLNNLIYPKLLQTQIVSHFGFLEAGELFVMLQIVAGWFVKYVLTFFALLKLLELMKVTAKWLPYLVSAAAFAIAVLATMNILNLFKALSYLMYFQLVNFLVIPLIVYTVFMARNKGIGSA